MNGMFEIAYAAASERLCFFTGTGFSKAVTGDSAPTWQGLLESLCDPLANSNDLRSTLFPSGTPHPLTLEESAQVIEIELRKIGRDIHQDAAAIITELKISGGNDAAKQFLSNHAYSVITTNYDKLIEELAGPSDCHSLTPGLPIPRSSARVTAYHVHGSIDSPENMVLTSDDYFKFINGQSYFSRKLSTILHENTVVILGYSLGDTNLKAILSDYRGFSRSHVVGSNIFLVSRGKVGTQIKDYYAHCYGIRVIDSCNVDNFFIELNKAIPKADHVSKTLVNINNVVHKNYKYVDDYLKLEQSFYEIVASIGAAGMSINDKKVVAALGTIIASKNRLTGENGAWSQYTHLANWLIYLASILEIGKTGIQDVYLAAVLHSMQTMGSNYRYGHSWAAYSSWEQQWSGIIASNRVLIRDHIMNNGPSSDSTSIVSRT